MPLNFFMVDGMRDDYVSEAYMPFLYRLSQEGEYVCKIYPSLGFCERVEILTGQVPEQSGFVMAYGYDRERSDYRNLPFLSLMHAVESSFLRDSKWKRRLRSRIAKVFRIFGIGTRPSQIPADFLPFFALTEDNINHATYRAFGVPSVLDELADAGGRFDYSTFTALGMENGTDEDRLQMALLRAKNGFDLQLIFIGILDQVGHYYGPDSEKMKETLRALDQKLQQFVEAYLRKIPRARFIFMGADGLVSVERRVDVEESLLSFAKKVGLKRVKDFVYFLDSTAVRVWFHSGRARALIPELFNQEKILVESGKVFTEENARRNRLPWGDRRYGDLIWWANPRTLVSPDFFHVGERILGMHGYDPNFPGQQSTLIHWGNSVERRVIPSLHLYEVHGLLKRSLFC